MSEIALRKRNRSFTLNEDWLAVVIGLTLVALTWVGIIIEVPWPLWGFLK